MKFSVLQNQWWRCIAQVQEDVKFTFWNIVDGEAASRTQTSIRFQSEHTVWLHQMSQCRLIALVAGWDGTKTSFHHVRLVWLSDYDKNQSPYNTRYQSHWKRELWPRLERCLSYSQRLGRRPPHGTLVLLMVMHNSPRTMIPFLMAF